MELEERVARLEKIVSLEGRVSRFELRTIRVFEIILLLVALAAPISWAIVELMLFLLNRWDSLKGNAGF